MKEKIAKLINVKSIVTIELTGVFAYLALRGNISKDFLTVYLMVISFYFGTQVEKNKNTGE